MNQKDFKNKSEMQIFLSYFKPHRKLFLLDMVCARAIAMIDLAFPDGVCISFFQIMHGEHSGFPAFVQPKPLPMRKKSWINLILRI